MHAKPIVFTTLFSTLALVHAAHAFQGEQSPLPPAPFQSTMSRADVQAQAAQPLHITNGGSGVARPTAGTVDRDAVRASATDIAPRGAAAYGEVADRRM